MPKSKYDPDTFPELAEKWAREGLTDLQIADNLGVKKDAFYRYIKKHPEFAEALKRGKAPVNFHVENALLKRAVGYDVVETKQVIISGQVHTLETVKHIPPDTTACIFWLKNRRKDRWRDKQEVEHSGEIQTTSINILSTADEDDEGKDS